MNPNIRQELLKTKALLGLEKEEDQKAFQNEINETSLYQQTISGASWYPVEVRQSNFDFGERLLITIHKLKQHKGGATFQTGQPVRIFASEPWFDAEKHKLSAVVNTAKDDQMVVTLNCEELPSWLNEGTLGVQKQFDSKSYTEMEKALDYLLKTEQEDPSRLLEVLLGDTPAGFRSVTHVLNTRLNQSQNTALSMVRSAEDVAIIHGPPGTGKTTTLVQAVAEVVKAEKQTLVCAPSNTAADLLVEKMLEQSLKVLRLGHPARITDAILSQTLDYGITHHPEYRSLSLLKRSAEQIHRKIGRYKRTFTQEDRILRKQQYSEARQLKEEAEQLEFYIISNLIENAEVIVTTLVGASSHWLKGHKFKTLFIDEAAQALEPACWIPILKTRRVVFAGDHFQLPPTVKSQKAGKQGLEITLFEKAIHRNTADCMLQTQYRMNELIMGFPSAYFYKNSLIAHEKVKHWGIIPDDAIVEFIDTSGCGFDEAMHPHSKSTYNVEEAELLIQHLDDYLKLIFALGWEDDIEDIGIISPYMAQVEVLKKYLFKEQYIAKERVHRIDINTIDSFQGQERDVIYLSLVRSNAKGSIGFLSDIRRINVAITRARKKLVIIGDTATIGQHPFYGKLIDYAHEIGAYRHAYEFLNK
jgi:predicted DNA helicase